MELMVMFLFSTVIAAVLSAEGRAVCERLLPKDHEGRDTALWQVRLFPFASALWFVTALLIHGDIMRADLGDGLELCESESHTWLGDANDEDPMMVYLTAIHVTQARLYFVDQDYVFGVVDRATRYVEFVSGLDELKAKAREAGIELRLEDVKSKIFWRNAISPPVVFTLAVPLVAGLALLYKLVRIWRGWPSGGGRWRSLRG
jgi:hypothetical protein